MTSPRRTPGRSTRTQRQPASPQALEELLHELNIQPTGKVTYKLVSKWAAKHVWRVDTNGEPWAFVRYLLGPAELYPDRWRHLRLARLINEEAHVGPRVLGLTPESEALNGRAVLVEAALKPIHREELEARAEEAITLMGRLHTSIPLHEELSVDLNETDEEGLNPLAHLWRETRERWFEAVVEQWLASGISEISDATMVVSEILGRLDTVRADITSGSIVVPTHGDPNHGNFMVNRQGALRMIDFEGLSLNNPVADLGVFLTWYVDRDRHRTLLESYPLGDPEATLERMCVWVPLRYLNIAAHWAARLTHAKTESAWEFAADSVDEWLRGACELTFDGWVPRALDKLLRRLRLSLHERRPQE